MLDTLLGNDAVRESLLHALRENRLAHSILLCGERGTGVGYAARCLAADYLYPDGGDGAKQVMANASGEYMCIVGEGASGDIKVEAVRAARRAVYDTALSANGRVVQLSEAQHLNIASANALLKVLEEPPEGVLFILTAPSEAAVLPTIRSRCASYTLAPISEAACVQYLKEHFPREKDAARLAALFGGKLGLCVRCVSQSAEKKLFAAAEQLVQEAAAGHEYAVMRLLAGYEKDRASARLLLELLCQLYAAALRGGYPALPAARAAQGLPALRLAQERVAANVNAKLALSVLAAQLTA